MGIVEEARRSKHSRGFIRVGVYAIHVVLGLTGNRRVRFGDHLVKMGSARYRVFLNSGTTCVNCGLEAKYFALERHRNDKSRAAKTVYQYHFNLYGVGQQGQEVLFTKDHIKPVSKGGRNTLENFQTMCTYCNNAKGDKYDDSED